MGWLTAVTYEDVSVRNDSNPTWETRTLQAPDDWGYVDGVLTNGGGQQTEQRRMVTTDTETTVSEATGLDRDTAIGGAQGATATGTEDNLTITRIDAQKANAADGWKLVRTVTVITVTRGVWTSVSEE